VPELTTEFRLFFDNEPATPEQLERVEKISVDQEIDMMWEGSVHLPLRVDAQGNWEDDDEAFMQPFARVRIEVRVGDGRFVPLIDGPIVGFDSKLSSEPGKSTMILTIHDDSVRLNQEDRISQYEDQTDDEIASEVFGQFGDIIQNTDIESTPASGSALTADIFQRGSSMQFLRRLARRQGMHAYVLPGEQPGQSVGVFRSLPKQPDGLTPLTLLGQDRNIEGFALRFNAQRPARVTATSLRITDQEIISGDSGSDDAESLGDGSLVESSSDISQVILPPQIGESVDIDQATRARAISAGFAVTGSGNTREDYYPDVMSPYRLVTLLGGNSPVSGDYLITRVTHTITRNIYKQSFKLSRNARTESTGPGGSSSSGSPGRGVF
jgi:phage protein D